MSKSHRNFLRRFSSRRFRIIFYSAFFLGFILASVIMSVLQNSDLNLLDLLPKSKEKAMSEELFYLQSEPFNFDDLSKYFKAKAEEKGAEYAFELLSKAEFSSEIDMHLLGHVVGEILYQQEGIKGIHICTQEFRNACSHALVIGLFQDEGPSALDRIADTCKDAPGAEGAYAMCFHGLGHGVLAYAGYDMAKTKEYCGKAGTLEEEYVEVKECMGGAVMEIVGGGGHDREAWEVMRKKYLNPDDPFGLCTSDLITENARSFCVMYLTPFLFEATGGSIHSNDDEQIRKAFNICETLKEDHEDLRMACYGSFGKEFPTIANNLDVRRIWEISDEGLEKVYHWCKLAEVEDGTESCMRHAIGALLWGGENEVDGAVGLCSIIDEENLQNECFHESISNTKHYTQENDPRREDLCRKIDPKYQEECRKELL